MAALNLATGREGGAVPKTIAVLGSALFFAVAPSSVAGLVPWWITHWEFRPPFFDLEATRAVGILLIVAGLPGLVDSFARFALQGLGTPAPIAPTQNLVVTGLYRYVRNPIYVALVAVILGQAALFGDQRLLLYGVLVWLAFHAFVVGYEEPALVHRFGTEYEDFRGRKCLAVQRPNESNPLGVCCDIVKPVLGGVLSHLAWQSRAPLRRDRVSIGVQI
jgi:protein-S-isoprenylcysteine O-methyltransferase Ste14